MATNTIRLQLATIEGAQSPFPYGGKQRQIEVDLDLNALQARGLSPADVVNAIAAQNVIAPRAPSSSTALNTRWRPTPRLRCSSAEQPARQNRERHDCLYPRCGACARRQSPANQYCPRRRPPRHHDEHPEDRLDFDARHYQGRARDHLQPHCQGPAAAADENRGSRRSIDLRPQLH